MAIASLPVQSRFAPRLAGLERLIGNTPLLAIQYEFGGRKCTLYAKSEQMNFTGSIKDCMALHILRDAYRQSRIRPGDTIVEATSGNTGISFAALGRALGHPVTIFMPSWMSRERTDLIHSLGAHIVSVSKADGGFLGSIRMAEELATRRDDVFLPRQFSNTANVQAHEQTTGPELYWQFEAWGSDRRCIRCRRGYRRYGDGRGPISKEDGSRNANLRHGTGRVADPLHRMQARQSPYSGHIR